MKLFVKLLILVLLLASVGPFFLKGPDGEPLWSYREVLHAAKAKLGRITSTPVSLPSPAALQPGDDVTVYRWQDASGEWHFAGEPPVGVSFDELKIDPDTNAIQMERAEPPVAAAPAESTAEPAAGDAPANDPYRGPLPDPEATRQLIEDARALQDLADERARRLREVDQ
ncbi:MAG: hypothetical protein AAFX58_04450 [Pseudomonadota bacterium]